MTSTADALTIAFADAQAGWHGWARLAAGRSLAVLLREGGEVITGGQGLRIAEDGFSWSGVEAAIEPVAAPVERRGGLPGVEQLVRVRGSVDGDAIDGWGQLGHTGGEADLSGLSMVRSVGVWLGEGDGIVLETSRETRAKGHGDEAVWATLVEHGTPVEVQDARLSTTYDGDRRQRRAGLELWMTEETGYPVRASGEVTCGTTVDLGELALDLAFLRWHSSGAVGVGRYDVLRRSA